MVLSPETPNLREPPADDGRPGRRESLFAAIGVLFGHKLRKRRIWAGDLEGIVVTALVCVVLFGCVLFGGVLPRKTMQTLNTCASAQRIVCFDQ